MRHPERLSVGPIRAEGPRATGFVMLIIAVVLGSVFYLGKMSAILDACFGLRPF
jgi:hypothetical protein